MKMWNIGLLCCLLGVCACRMTGLYAQSLQFTNVQRLNNKEVRLNLTAPAGRAYRIETTTNLPDWNNLFTFPTNVSTSLSYTDSAAPYLPTRYYRAAQLTGTNISGDHLTTTNGDIIIQPRFHATFVMQWNGLMIYNDPAPSATYAGLPKADLILISHDHGDHMNTTHIDNVRGTNALIIVPPYVYANNLTAPQRAISIILTNGASTNVMGMTIESVPAYNPIYHSAGQGNAYVLTIGGKRIFISGDTGNTAQMRALTNIDVAFVCMNLPFTMTVGEATNAVRAFRPKIVYPYHYRNQDNTTANAATFKQWLGTDLGIEVRLRSWY